MGEFHEAVSTLLSFFGEGLSSIKAHSEKKSKRRLASEARLGESLRKSRNDVRTIYDRDLEKYGEKFAKGDGYCPLFYTAKSLAKIIQPKRDLP
jgi:hypothetical protein